MGMIPFNQNSAAQIALLAARNRTRSSLRSIFFAQATATVLIPLAGAILVAHCPIWRPHVAAFALLFTSLDIWLLDRMQKKLQVKVAKLAEHFDCEVLRLPWDAFGVGKTLLAEEMLPSADESTEDDTLSNWYPPIAGQLPDHAARLVCQRSNLRYDGALRKSFASIILVLPAIIVITLFIWGFVEKSDFASWVVILATLMPLLAWTAREHYRQVDSAKLNDDLLETVNDLWTDVLSGIVTPSGCSVKSRELQTAIYRRRSGSPPVWGRIYLWQHEARESEMLEVAQRLCDDFAASFAFKSVAEEHRFHEQVPQEIR